MSTNDQLDSIVKQKHFLMAQLMLVWLISFIGIVSIGMFGTLYT